MKGYFDHNATTPLHPDARDAWVEASAHCWHNASSLYREAALVRRRLDEAREQLADWLGAEPERLIFTSGATESNNTVAHVAARRASPTDWVLSSGVEHPSVREPLQKHFSGRVRLIRSLPDTRPDLTDFIQDLHGKRPALVSAMAANNECGTLLPWREMAAACRDLDIPFHCDASQWTGKLPMNGLGLCDYVTGSAHKFGGPKGTGFLLLRDEDEKPGFLCGGPQEEKRRAGTENYPGIAAMLAALHAAQENQKAVSIRQQAWRDAFAAEACLRLPGTRVIGGDAPRLWNTVMLVLPRHDNRKWLARLSDRGFAISTGSACSAGSSVVLAALGADAEEMRRVVRVSGGWDTAQEDWVALAEALTAVAQDLGEAPLERRS